MKRRLIQGFLSLLVLVWLAEGAAWATQITITTSWTRVRKNPSLQSSAVDIAYGNDTYTVLKTENNWVQIRTGQGAVGWIAPEAYRSGEAHLLPNGVAARELGQASALQRSGYTHQARDALIAILLRYGEQPEFYEATRRLLLIYDMPYLQPKDLAQVQLPDMLEAHRRLPRLLAVVGMELNAEGRYREAAETLQQSLQRDPTRQDVRDALLSAVRQWMTNAEGENNDEELAVAVIAHQNYFPALELPRSVQMALTGRR